MPLAHPPLTLKLGMGLDHDSLRGCANSFLLSSRWLLSNNNGDALEILPLIVNLENLAQSKKHTLHKQIKCCKVAS